MIGFLISLMAATAVTPIVADYTGRWIFEDVDETVVFELQHDTRSGRVAGTLLMDGSSALVEGRLRVSDVVMETVNGLPISFKGVAMTMVLDGSDLVVTTQSQGEEPVVVRMKPVASSLPAENYAGRWEAISDDGTRGEVLELSISGGAVDGTLSEVVREYPSMRESIQRVYVVSGAAQNGNLIVTLHDQKAPDKVATATIIRRNKYLVIQMNNAERGYARPGEALVENATGNPEAAALERAISGRVYSSALETSAGLVGGRRAQLALCSNGQIVWTVNDRKFTGGHPATAAIRGENSVTWRGTWSVVMLAGSPAVRAQWQGVGSPAALTDYFIIRPSSAGDTALVDGKQLALSGAC